MTWLSNAFRRLGPAFLAFALLLSLEPTKAGAGHFEDALTLVRSGDIDRIERSFAD